MKQQKICNKKPNLFMDFQPSNLPNPKVQFFSGGGIWVYCVEKKHGTRKNQYKNVQTCFRTVNLVTN